MELEIIDVTIIEPQRKHPSIFQKFDSLTGGEGFIIHNDHDPKPLYYQLLAERGNTFSWAYLENGPEWWKVRIVKLEEGVKEETIGEMVKKDYRKAEVFKKFGLDFCCGGKKTLTKVCREKGLDIVEIERELNIIENAPSLPSQNFENWNLDFLADYIVNTHHRYIAQSFPLIFEYTQKIARVHGDRHPELITIAETFVKLINELNCHMMKEENVLFPYVKELVNAKKSGDTPEPAFGSVKNPVAMMEHEHVIAGDLMRKINELTNNYNPPADACNSYRVAFAKLKEFEDDLHQHIHLENNILFPAATKLEEELMSR